MASSSSESEYFKINDKILCTHSWLTIEIKNLCLWIILSCDECSNVLEIIAHIFIMIKNIRKTFYKKDFHITPKQIIFFTKYNLCVKEILGKKNTLLYD